MLIGLARGATALARRTDSLPVLAFARAAHAAAQWLRGGEFSPLPGGERVAAQRPGEGDDYGLRLMNEGLPAAHPWTPAFAGEAGKGGRS